MTVEIVDSIMWGLMIIAGMAFVAYLCRNLNS